MDLPEGIGRFRVELDESYRPLPSVCLALLTIWLLSAFSWTINTYKNRHFQMNNLQWMLASVPLIKAVQLMLSFLFWYSCVYHEICSLWLSFGVYITGVLFQTASLVSFLLISHGYCIMCERLSATERRATAALGFVFYLSLVGYKASVPYFTLTFIEDEDVRDMHDAVYTKYIMFKKFQGAMQVAAIAETVIYINVDTSSENYWLRFLVKEWAQLCISMYIGWTFRSKGLAPRFFVMPTIKSQGDMTVPPVYSVEMDAATFKDFNCNEWHIGVPISSSCDKSSMDSIVVVIQHPHPLRLPTATTAS
ncbi:hypothetical protein MANES_11G035900v8 [Manihot esculenta]|uniref:Uncharacterized protein n=1 Tax=Manihot esculenta TaxID=3983 RepID=A0ACB7GSM0_MANES|nr:hypothetical protein MANES_11G035900v8 [Manihot esculenta]